MAQSASPDIATHRLGPAEIAANFADIKPPFDRKKALIESSRCYFCHDAPCIEACPTSIDVPNFIRMINTGNVAGAGQKILEQNILGGMCARVCPTEILCEDACVRNNSEDKPVQIGMLQRVATDSAMEAGRQPFARGARTGKRVAVIGGGPAGLSCAHRLAVLGHDVTIFDAREKLGGLNEYGIAAYKTVNDFARREVDFVTAIGGIEIKAGMALGRDLLLSEVRREFDAVFIGTGLAGVNALGLEGEGALQGVLDAVDYIAKLRQAPDKGALAVGRKIVVIGGGNTAIDIAIQTKRLGAEEVTLIYRRGPENMSATWHEQEFAQVNGVKIRHWARPVRLIGHQGAVREIEFERTRLEDGGRLVGTGETYALACDMVFKAIGQKLVKDALNGAAEPLETLDGKIVVNEDMKTSISKVWAGGDCVASGNDLTVRGVEDGKIAAHAIDRALRT